MLRTILFDLGNVLVHFCHQQMCRQIGALAGKTGEEVWKALFDEGLLSELECGRVSEDEFQSRFERALGSRFEAPALRRAASDIFTLNEPLRPILDELKQRGLRLVLLSNTSLAHHDWVREQFDVLELFDDVVVSYQVGATKPSAAIFERALEVIDCEPQECFYTDDIEAYVLKAREFGLHAEVFTGVDALLQQLARLGVDLRGPSGVEPRANKS